MNNTIEYLNKNDGSIGIDGILRANGDFPLTNANQVKGGMHHFNTIQERDAMPILKASPGMLAYVIETDIHYKLIYENDSFVWKKIVDREEIQTFFNGGEGITYNNNTGEISLTYLRSNNNVLEYSDGENWNSVIGDITSINVTTGLGLQGGASGTIGDITGNISLNHLGLENLIDPNSNSIFYWNNSTKKSEFLNIGDGLLINSGVLSNTIINNNQLINGSGYITADSSDTLTNKSGNISQWTNDVGYITDGNTNWNNTYGFITGINWDEITGNQLDINLSGFNNDSGFTTFDGDYNSLTNIPTYTQGSIIFADSDGSLTENNSNLYWDNVNNRLGIGTTKPTVSLQIGKITTNSENQKIIVTGYDNSQIEFNNHNNWAKPTISTNFGGGVSFVDYGFQNNTLRLSLGESLTRQGSLHIFNNNSESISIGLNGTYPIATLGIIEEGPNYTGGLRIKTRLSTNLTNDFYFSKYGNFGIGTITPTQKLDVNGNIKADGILKLYDITDSQTISLNPDGDSYINSGNLGISTTTPTEKLHINGNAIVSGIGVGTSTIYSNSINITNSGTLRIGNAEFLSKTNNDLSIYQGKVTVNSDGNVGIGTTSPTEKLDVNGNIKTNGILKLYDVTDTQTISLNPNGDSYSLGNLIIGDSNTNRTVKIADDGLYISRTTDGIYTSAIKANSDGNDLDILARSSIFFKHNNNAVNSLTLYDYGHVQIPTYGQGNVSGATQYVLGVDLNGKIIESEWLTNDGSLSSMRIGKGIPSVENTPYVTLIGQDTGKNASDIIYSTLIGGRTGLNSGIFQGSAIIGNAASSFGNDYIYSVIIGEQAGQQIGLNRSVAIGYRNAYSTQPQGSFNNTITIGSEVTPTANGQIIIGNNDNTSFETFGQIKNSSYGQGNVLSDFVTDETSLPVFDANGNLVESQVISINNGNVGIGTTSPTEKLDVDGNIKLNGSMTIFDGNQLNLNSTGNVYSGYIKKNGYQGEISLGRTIDIIANRSLRLFDNNGNRRWIFGTVIADTTINNIFSSFSNSNIYAGHNGYFGFYTYGSTLPINVLGLFNRLDNNNNGVKLLYKSASIEYEGLVINNVGKVGIGTTSPSEKLDVYGNIKAYGILKLFDITDTQKIEFNPDGNSYINVGNLGIGTSSPIAKLQIRNDDGSSSESINKLAITGGNGGNNLIMKVQYLQDAGVMTLGYAGLAGDSIILNGGTSNAGSNVVLKEDGIPKILFDSKTNSYFNSGNVGIGTTSPTEKLDVSGKIKSESFVLKDDLDTEIRASIFSNSDGDGCLRLYNGLNTGFIATGYSTQPRIGSFYAGKLFIRGFGNSTGVTNPNDIDLALFDFLNKRVTIGVSGTDTDLFVNGNVRTDGSLQLFDITDTQQIELNPDGDSYINGNLGIGTASPNAKMHIKAGNSGATPISQQHLILEHNSATGLGILTTSLTSGYIFFGDETNAQIGYIGYSHPTDSMIFKIAGSERIRIDSSGNVGINTTSPTERLDVVGNIKSSGYITGKRCGAAGYLASPVNITVTTANTYYPIGVFTVPVAADFVVGTTYPNGLKYTGTIAQTFHITWNATIESTSNNVSSIIDIEKNGVSIPMAKMGTYSKTGGEIYNLNGQCVVDLDVNDEIRFVVTANNNGEILTFDYFTASIKEFFD